MRLTKFLQFKSLALLMLAIMFLSGCAANTHHPEELQISLNDLKLVHMNPGQPIAVHSPDMSTAGFITFGVLGMLAVEAVANLVDENKAGTKASSFQQMYTPDEPYAILYQQLSDSFLAFDKATSTGTNSDDTIGGDKPVLKYEYFYHLSHDTKTLQLALVAQLHLVGEERPYYSEILWQDKSDEWNKESFTAAIENGSREIASLLVRSYLDPELQAESKEKYHHYILLDPKRRHNVYKRGRPISKSIVGESTIYRLNANRFIATEMKSVPLEEYSSY